MSIIDGIIGIVISASVFLLSVSCHEFAHGYSAYLMGDNSAKLSGRLSLNPLRHFDAFAVIFFLVFRFGWAKGVPVNPMNFKDRRKGMVYSALAGPLTNIFIMFISLIILKLIYKIPFRSEVMYNIFYYIAVFFRYMVSVNAMLAIFNLFPMPPLDGSKIFFAVLPERLYFKALSYDRYMMIVSLLLVYSGVLDKFIFTGVDNLISLFDKLVGVFI